MMTYRYLVHNLFVRMNEPLLNLPVLDDPPARGADITVTALNWEKLRDWLEQRRWAPDPHGQTGEPWFAMLTAGQGPETLHRFDFVNSQGGRATYVARNGGTRIMMGWDIPHMTDDDAVRVVGEALQTRVLGYLLRLSGRLCLHGGAVAAGGQAIGFLGPSGAGKSTLVAALMAHGYPLVTDDRIVADMRDGAFLVQPGRQSIRLWPQSLDVLNFEAPAITTCSGTDKCSIDLPEANDPAASSVHEKAIPLGALYILAHRDPNLERPSIHALPSPEALLHLLANRYGSVNPPPSVVAGEYTQLGRLARRIPVRLIQRPDNLDLLPQLTRMIMDDCPLDSALPCV